MAKTSYLPPEILEIILSKSSVKPLLRFKAVSKSWKAIISDPLFLKNHHPISKSSNSQDLFVCDLRFPRGFTLIKLEDQALEIVQALESPYGYNNVLCHCQGLLLLTDHSYRRHLLWNPSTRTQTKFWIHYKCDRANYGLCHEPNTGDLKVVIVDVDKEYYSVFSCKYKSLIIRKEKFTDTYTDICRSCYDDPGVCVDGAIYWAWSDKNNAIKIIYYDSRDDKFKILEKPGNVEKSEKIYLVDLGGFLCLRCVGKDNTTIKIWIKEKGIDNSVWNDFITIENAKMDIWCFEPQCLMGNKIVFRNRCNWKLLVYSPFEKTLEQFEDKQIEFIQVRIVPYIDSPFFPVKTAPKSKRKRVK